MENKNKYIGIDPGIRTTGWGIIVSENSRLKYLSHGIIENKKLVNDEFRLLNIFEKLTSIITSFKPNIAVVEQVFVSKNANSALKLGMARGIVLLACAMANLEVREISARKVKKVITGTGSAEKKQIVKMISNLLSIQNVSNDAADALGMAVAGSHGGYENFDDFNKYSENNLSKAIKFALEKEKL